MGNCRIISLSYHPKLGLNEYIVYKIKKKFFTIIMCNNPITTNSKFPKTNCDKCNVKPRIPMSKLFIYTNVLFTDNKPILNIAFFETIYYKARDRHVTSTELNHSHFPRTPLVPIKQSFPKDF